MSLLRAAKPIANCGQQQPHSRANEQPDLGRHGLRLLLICASVPSRQMRFLREQYAPGASSGEEPIVHAEGEECGLVTRGTVELTVDGSVSVLNAGDGYYFPTTLPHSLGILGRMRLKLLVRIRRRIFELSWFLGVFLAASIYK